MADRGQVVATHLAEHEDDEHGRQRGYVKGTDFALPYVSQWSRLHSAEAAEGVLRHVNCGYLSTHGVAPTLLALKQHAQSLCILIHALSPTLRSAEIADGDPARTGKGRWAVADDPLAFKYELNDAFDFLCDLTAPYTNDDPSHHKPLTALVNEVRGRHEAHGTAYHCPFAETRARPTGAKQKPYANHHSLVMHANACLERLDHEFSTTGGLMSILPTTAEHDTQDLQNARNSLLGQWLLFTQHLVARMHDLERAYGNALDALAGEAAIPHQHLSTLGPDARSAGRAIAYPQDRFVLANAGDDVFARIHDLLDQQETLHQAREKLARRNGVASDHLSSTTTTTTTTTHHARGIVPVTVATRYYRLAGQGRGTLFVLPAWEHHPAVAHTRAAEAQPTVVAVAHAKFPARATELETRYHARLAHAARAAAENLALRAELDAARAAADTLRRQNELLAVTRDALMLAAGEGEAGLAARAHQERCRAERAERELEAAGRERDGARAREERLRAEVEALRREAADTRAGVDAE
ncbi:hypothetical protein BT67DRAFT_379677 [Trichocladium antarcticum]|uniref:Uncharacterized protein n=1 Tax=Trichocladium antarcticum TaxID=1450529 RepID=A0AAN6ZDV9_9PEZI|nr:hypothetical protein BT67DRAFT_379677 [Trichocladium antarcticum]